MINHHTINGKRVQSEQNYIPGLRKTYKRAERRRLDGKKPTPVQIRKMVHRTKRITPMESNRVIDEITQAMMPETNDINHFVGVK